MAFGVLLLASLLLASFQAAECADAGGCRRAALDAAARGDYETFHDLAWRAVQTGQRNDPELMYLLARAQSLSGRPGDALVMLRRLAAMGVATDARQHEDFQSVRRLAGWPDVEALFADAPAPTDATMAAADEPARPAAAVIDPAPADRPAAAPVRPAPAPASPAAAAATGAGRGETARRLAAVPLDPAGLAYDGASRRFVLGDRRLNRLVVADEVFDQVNDLIGAAAGGFGTLTALAIDSRRGDLWVTSARADGAASIHKLQLVSGRLLSSLDVPEGWRPATLVDLAVTDGGSLLLLDAAGSRLLMLRGGAQTFERPVALGVTTPSSLAASADTAYVAHEDGLSMTDLATGRVTALRMAPGAALTGLLRIRWHNGSLIGLQRLPGTGDRIVRIRLTRGTATAVDVLDDHVSPGGSVLALSRDAAYYLADDDGVQVIRRVPLR